MAKFLNSISLQQAEKQIAAYEITAKEVLGLRQRTEKLESTYKTFRTSGVKGYG